MLHIGSKNFDLEIYPLKETTIGYILRYRNAKNSSFDQCHHGECILPYGLLVGFAYNNEAELLNDNYYRRKMENYDGRARYSTDPDFPKRHIDLELAIRRNFFSSALIINVDKYLSRQFESFWRNISRKYNKYFYNCSTACYQAFREIGIIPRIMPLLPEIITPESLYKHLSKCLKKQETYNWAEKQGFIGLEQARRFSKGKNLLIAKQLNSARV